ncbi:MFS transporter [Aspergillus heteromorphus CBS 117.55]|uniref:MFS transporter n=1 Tax=Aspergillus heteromorphus CBS 117.55 TaxID=1448321 RepID=A0A317VFZ0_9EURO|nr:MFS transporter [Aspergillus heteromorphus CBS 117.55]PWY72359.1 MFS transporter [Aspergillus heteromorphus CBS 117.55]
MLENTPRLPVRQLLILSICRFAEPVVLTSVLPYLPEMIESLHIPPALVPKYVGLTTAITSLSQATMAITWGSLSDTYGRKPIILLGLFFTMFFSLVFGFSTSLPMLIISRGFLGLMNGNVGIIRTMVAEMVPQKELQPRAFSVMPLVWTVGSIFGPAFGGALAKPVEKFGSVFGGDEGLWGRFPFALPNVLAAGFFVVGIATGWLFLEETLASKKNQRDHGLVLGRALTSCGRHRDEKTQSLGRDDERTALLRDAPKTAKKPAKKPSWADVFSPQSKLILLAYSLMSMHTMAFDSLLPVFLHTPVQQIDGNPDVRLPFKFVGGFGDIDSQTIGTFYTLIGILGMLIQFLIFPIAAHRLGILPCLKIVVLIFPLLYLLTPFTALVPSPSFRNVTIFFLMLGKLSASIFGFPCITVLLTNSATSLGVLGTLNGVGTSFSAIGRAVGPALTGQAFSWGLREGFIVVPWWLLALFGAVSAVPVFCVVEGDGFDGGAGDDEEEEVEVEEEVEEEERGRGRTGYGAVASR